MFAPATDEDVIALVKITNPDWSDTIRTSSYPSEVFDPVTGLQGTTHNSQPYYFGLLSYERPDDAQGELPEGNAVIQNVEQDIGLLAGPDAQDCVVKMIHVVKSAPDIILIEFDEFVIRGATAAMEMVSLDLSLDPDQAEPVPFEIISPETCPGMFR